MLQMGEEFNHWGPESQGMEMDVSGICHAVIIETGNACSEVIVIEVARSQLAHLSQFI